MKYDESKFVFEQKLNYTSGRSRITGCLWAIFQLAKMAIEGGRLDQPRLDSEQGLRFALSPDREFRDSVDHNSPTQQEDSLISHHHTHFCLILVFAICGYTAFLYTPVFPPPSTFRH
jgi:hypothetical protein